MPTITFKTTYPEAEKLDRICASIGESRSEFIRKAIAMRSGLPIPRDRTEVTPVPKVTQ